MKKRNNVNRQEFHFKAKIFVYNADNTFQKMVPYHGVDSRGNKLEQFHAFLQKQFPGVHHVNYYGGISKRFQFQHRFIK